MAWRSGDKIKVGLQCPSPNFCPINMFRHTEKKLKATNEVKAVYQTFKMQRRFEGLCTGSINPLGSIKVDGIQVIKMFKVRKGCPAAGSFEEGGRTLAKLERSRNGEYRLLSHLQHTEQLDDSWIKSHEGPGNLQQ